MAETKHEKFVRLAESRMENTLKQIEILSNLSNRSAYEYSEEEAKKIIKRLKEAISDLEEDFLRETRVKKFKL